MKDDLLKALRIPRVFHFKMIEQHGFGYTYDAGPKNYGSMGWTLTIMIGRHEWDIESR